MKINNFSESELELVYKSLRGKSKRKSYLESRKDFFPEDASFDKWKLIDNWSLYAGEESIARYLCIADIFKETLSIPGDILEFGTRDGRTLIFLAKLLRIYSYASVKRLFAFDTFEGLQDFVDEDGRQSEEFSGSYIGDLEMLENVINFMIFSHLSILWLAMQKKHF